MQPLTEKLGAVLLSWCNVSCVVTDVLGMKNIKRAVRVVLAALALASTCVVVVPASAVADVAAPSPVLLPVPLTAVSGSGASAVVFPNHFANGFSCHSELNPLNELELICRKSNEVMENV